MKTAKRFTIFAILVCLLAVQLLGAEEEIRVEGGGFSIFAAPLYWKAKETGIENWAQTLDINKPKGRIDVHSVHFHWDHGIRVGAALRFPCNCFDTELTYTHFHTQGDDHAQSDALIASSFIGNFYFDNLAGFAFSGPQYHEASIRWNIDFDMFDWVIGRKCCIWDSLVLRPFMGVKGGRIDQTIRSEWRRPNNTRFTFATENIKNNFRGLGPTVGVNTEWKLWHCPNSFLALFGDASGAILWGKWKIEDIYKNDAPYVFPVIQSNTRGGSTMACLCAGIEWKQFLEKKLAFFSVRIGYETQYWFDQLQFYSFNMGRLSGQLSLQGLTAQLRVDF